MSCRFSCFCLPWLRGFGRSWICNPLTLLINISFFEYSLWLYYDKNETPKAMIGILKARIESLRPRSGAVEAETRRRSNQRRAAA